MKIKHYRILVALLERQSAECAKLSERAYQSGDLAGKAFQAGAREALKRATDYVKDAQAGILE